MNDLDVSTGTMTTLGTGEEVLQIVLQRAEEGRGGANVKPRKCQDRNRNRRGKTAGLE